MLSDATFERTRHSPALQPSNLRGHFKLAPLSINTRTLLQHLRNAAHFRALHPLHPPTPSMEAIAMTTPLGISTAEAPPPHAGPGHVARLISDTSSSPGGCRASKAR